ncbi:hypothetical protein EI427_09220 [Flammeovirga pectinis]|uniref:Type ISP restriction-modification enzyme LLaBIII C-terminal specificity domain-containing protein n=1 Tax=Flammeovirga pectinis TaxID=2494373 RepID=A0A3Q9FNN1_9BACT|nr:type ISP restriction/modification enzyme [Flammeovirga pectinis]AZQ62410.1 hypothetical protein EI427_09220 [Flammeovirga pectinis]
MIGEAIQSLQQQLLFAGNYKAEAQENGKEMIKAFKKSFFSTFNIDDLLRLISEHVVSKQILFSLKDKSALQAVFSDHIYILFEEIIEQFSENEVLSDTQNQLKTTIDVLLQNGQNKEELFTQLMGREEGEPLPNYFLGMFKSLMRKHLNNSGKDAQYLYPSFTLPPFLDIEAKSNTLVCYDLLVYYWSTVNATESNRSFGNSLSFVDILPQGQKHLNFAEEDSNLNKLTNLNRDPVQIVFGTIQQMSLGNRTAHKEWTSRVKKVFSSDQKRNPVSYWLLWAKERLGNNGILVIRGDHSLAAAPEFKQWRQQTKSICSRVYIQAHLYSNQIIYCFIFSKDDEHEGVYYAPSYLEDFSPISNDSDDWITLSSEEYSKFLCLYSQKEKSIFNQSVATIQLKNKTWFTDFNKQQLKDKLKVFEKSQKKGNTLKLDDQLSKFDEKNIIRAYVKPFTKKWIYASELDVSTWESSHLLGFNKENPSLVLSANQEYGFESIPCTSPILSDFFERKQRNTILPLKVYKEDGSSSENISDWALNRFKQYYLPRLPEVGKTNTVSSILETLIPSLEQISRHTSRLPVLDKYTKTLFNYTEEEETPLEKVVATSNQLTTKMLQLYKNMPQKKQLVTDISSAVNSISEKINTIEKVKIEREYKEALLTKENIFYYTFAIVSHPLYKIDYEKELIALPPRIPLLNDFWKWAKIGKECFKASIYTNELTSEVQVVEGDDIDKANNYKINSSQFIKTPENYTKNTWGKSSIFDLIVHQFKERKPLNKALQKYFNDKVSKINCIELVKNIELQAQSYTKIKESLPESLFDHNGPIVRLKRRKK